MAKYPPNMTQPKEETRTLGSGIKSIIEGIQTVPIPVNAQSAIVRPDRGRHKLTTPAKARPTLEKKARKSSGLMRTPHTPTMMDMKVKTASDIPAAA
jgi:hypothetical protein